MDIIQLLAVDFEVFFEPIPFAEPTEEKANHATESVAGGGDEDYEPDVVVEEESGGEDCLG